MTFAAIEAGFAASLSTRSAEDVARIGALAPVLALTPTEHAALAGALTRLEGSAKPGKSPRARQTPSIEVYDPNELTRAISLHTKPASEDGLDEILRASYVSQGATAIADALQRIARHKDGARRTLAAPGWNHLLDVVVALHGLAHLDKVRDVIANAVRLSIRSQSGLLLPPLLFNGPPGVGKSWVAGAIAKALGFSPMKFAMGVSNSLSSITGLSPSWKDANVGRLATEILFGQSAAPFFILDEIDKLGATHYQNDPHGALLTLLESETARDFKDELLEIPFRVDRVMWALTSNDRSLLPGHLLDRLLVVDVPEPDADTRRRIALSLFADANASAGNAFAAPDEDVLDAVAAVGLRQARRIFALAMGVAAAAERTTVEAGDIASARRLAGADLRLAPKMGF